MVDLWTGQEASAAQREAAGESRSASQGEPSVAVEEIKPTHVFLATWLRQATEAENTRVNAAMVSNLLDALSSQGTVEHVALVTGLKHFLGRFETYGKGRLPATPFHEEQGRLDVKNLYYAEEDIQFLLQPSATASPGACTACT